MWLGDCWLWVTEGLLTLGADCKAQGTPCMWRPWGENTQLWASFLSDLTDFFLLFIFSFWPLLLPLFLAILFLHLHFIIYIWWTRRIKTRLPCKFGLVTHHVIIQLALKSIMLLTVNLKTFLISILSPSLTNHGNYLTWINVENHKAFLTTPRKTIFSIEEICLETSHKSLPGVRVHGTMLILWKYLYSCSFSAVTVNLLYFHYPIKILLSSLSVQCIFLKSPCMSCSKSFFLIFHLYHSPNIWVSFLWTFLLLCTLQNCKP